MNSRYTLRDLQRDFPDDESCFLWLVNSMYPDSFTCGKCGKTPHYRVTGRKAFACGSCGRHIHPLGGTIYHKSSTPLTIWFYALFMMSTHKGGYSAAQLQRDTGVTYKTAWRINHQIRTVMSEDISFEKEVEIDETFVHANTFKRSSARKRYGADARRTGEVVFGIVQRGGSVKMWHVSGANASTLIPIIKQNVPLGTVIHSDCFKGYYRLSQLYDHRMTNHSIGEFYTPDSYTQNIENVWSHLKRGLKGVYRHIDRKYLQNYANEFSWRYNHRFSLRPFWELLSSSASPLA